MMRMIFTMICFCVIMLVNPAYAFNDGSEVVGKYVGNDGSVVTVEKISYDTFKFSCNEPGGYKWETIAFYSKDGNYFKGVFRYKNHSDKYGDHLGFHKFQLNGNELIKSGGWDDIVKFGTGIFKRTN